MCEQDLEKANKCMGRFLMHIKMVLYYIRCMHIKGLAIHYAFLAHINILPVFFNVIEVDTSFKKLVWWIQQLKMLKSK